jgi:hypothetical protein
VAKRRLSLRITDFSDRELLAIVGSLDAQEGGASTAAIAEQIWPNATRDPESDDAFHARSAVASRMNWMRRYGVVNRNGEGSWQLTGAGDQVLNARISNQVETAISQTTDFNLIAVQAGISNRYAAIDPVAADVLRREWQFGKARRHK